jgi:saccharopine dehydrogenase-like NADP-dependent oxidoreductase
MMMTVVMVAGAGNIGRMIACFLADTKDYHVYLADCDFSGPDTVQLLDAMPSITPLTLDMKNEHDVQAVLKKYQVHAVISSLPYFLNPLLAKSAKQAHAHYFDLTEDIKSSDAVKALAQGARQVFVPQCGLAPGAVGMIAHHMMRTFDTCYEAKLRVGALPQNTSNALHYSLTWSIEGLINEYGEACSGIENGAPVMFVPLEGLESIQLEGDTYEAFHTSGGLGGLSALYQGKINRLTYKTIRHPGHCEKMHFLMHTLQLNDDRDTLKKILERAIPKTYQDMVLVYVSVEGLKQGEMIEENYVKKIYPKCMHGLEWSAIQISTAAAVCAVFEEVLRDEAHLHGLVLQEYFDWDVILKSRFGRFYA